MSKEIEIYHRWCEVDKQHEYGIVCRQNLNVEYANYWIQWIWYKLGDQLTKKEKKSFKILPFANTWDEKCKLIKSYKTCNSGTDRVVPAIRNHFKKLTTPS